MFQVQSQRPRGRFKLLVGGLVLLSVTNLLIGLWLMADVWYEQGMVATIVKHLSAADREEALALARELRMNARLVVLVVVNVVAGTIATSMLVNAYAHSQRRLHEARVAANDILFSLRHAVVTIDKRGVMTSFNPNAQSLLNLQPSEIGMPLVRVADQHPPLDAIAQDLEERCGGSLDVEYHTMINGHHSTVLAGCSVLRNEQNDELGRILHLHDVTENVLMEKRLNRMERYQSLGALAAGLHHEIRNPLSALSLHIQLLREALEQGKEPARIRQIMDVLGTEVKRMTSVLDGFRDFASAAQLNPSEFDLAQSIKSLIEFVSPTVRQQSIEIDFVNRREPDSTIQADRTKIEQVLLNLVVNAMQAMPAGGRLGIELDQEGEYATVTVRDTGPGIPDKLQKRVFEPYFSTKKDGTGLGLALCEKLVQQHGGTIRFETSPEGTTFVISLPEKFDR